MSSVVGIPGDPNTYYGGAASGGIWKTKDGGINWQPIFDNQQVSSIGALAVAKSNPNIERRRAASSAIVEMAGTHNSRRWRCCDRCGSVSPIRFSARAADAPAIHTFG